MNNEELKKKIADIIYHTGCTGACCECYYSKVSDADTYCKALLKADALVAAGIGDVGEWKAYSKVHRIVITKDDKIKQLYSDEEVDKIVSERAEFKHRAAVAERALSCLVHEMYEHGIRPMCDEKFFIESRLKEAEKDLAEEGEDDSRGNDEGE